MRKGIRWYDRNPRISFAVNHLEKADKELRKTLVRMIIKKAMGFMIKIERPKKTFFRRWYDKDKELSLAMEYFKSSNDSQRDVIAEQIITYISNNNLCAKENNLEEEETDCINSSYAQEINNKF